MSCTSVRSSVLQELQYAMRRAGQNPTDIEVQDLINKIDNGSGTMDFEVANRKHSDFD